MSERFFTIYKRYKDNIIKILESNKSVINNNIKDNIKIIKI